MATLYEYFLKDASRVISLEEKWTISSNGQQKLGDIIARLHLDFETRAKYISYYIPDLNDDNIALFAIDQVPKALELGSKTEIISGEDDELTKASDLIFTGQINLYSERPILTEFRKKLINNAKKLGYRLTIRSREYVEVRDVREKPLAFISHDSRDKEDIARSLALKLQDAMCPVWYDEYSLKVGDSLRESIEKGLRECSKCILILSPNFLSNDGWSKLEYESVFTREVVEKKKVILPIWHQVSPKDVFEYSPVLADRVAIDWSLGEDIVVKKLLHAIKY